MLIHNYKVNQKININKNIIKSTNIRDQLVNMYSMRKKKSN